MVGCLLGTATLLSAQIPKDLVGIYVWNSSERDGRPSECDCDYMLERIDLQANGKFVWMRQIGRLEPKREFESGTWSLSDIKYVVLTIKYYKITTATFGQENSKPAQWQRKKDFQTFQLEGKDLHDGEVCYKRAASGK